MKIKCYTDLHTHGIGRYDTRTANAEDILRMAELYRKAGTTAFLPTIYPDSISEMRKNMAAVKAAIKLQNSGMGATVKQSAIILGVNLEGPFLNPARCGALGKEFFIKPNRTNLHKLIAGYEDIIKIITVAPEMPGALKIIERSSELGIRVNMGHSDATYRQASDGKRAGATGITHIFNAMRPFHHREPGLVGFGLLDEDIYIEVIADGVHLHPEVLRLIFSTKKHDRVILVSDSVKGAGKEGRPVYKSKGLLAGSGITMTASEAVIEKAGITIDKVFFRTPEIYLTKII